MTERLQVQTWRACLVAAIFLPFAAAATPLQQPPEADALELDQALQKIKEQALDINAEAQRAEDEFLYPDFTRVTVYFGVQVKGLLVKNVSVSVDDGTPAYYQFSSSEAVALQKQGLYPVVRLNAPPGTHRIRAQYTAQFADAKTGEAPISGGYEAYFNKDLRPANLELYVSREGYLSQTFSLKMHEWRAER